MTLEALRRTYAKPKIPQPIGVEASWHAHFGFAQYECSVCSCTWTDIDYANPRTDWCDEDRLGCPCHSGVWWAVLVEGSHRHEVAA
jgi:hypothetical protein